MFDWRVLLVLQCLFVAILTVLVTGCSMSGTEDGSKTGPVTTETEPVAGQNFVSFYWESESGDSSATVSRELNQLENSAHFQAAEAVSISAFVPNSIQLNIFLPSITDGVTLPEGSVLVAISSEAKERVSLPVEVKLSEETNSLNVLISGLRSIFANDSQQAASFELSLFEVNSGEVFSKVYFSLETPPNSVVVDYPNERAEVPEVLSSPRSTVYLYSNVRIQNPYNSSLHLKFTKSIVAQLIQQLQRIDILQKECSFEEVNSNASQQYAVQAYLIPAMEEMPRRWLEFVQGEEEFQAYLPPRGEIKLYLYLGGGTIGAVQGGAAPSFSFGSSTAYQCREVQRCRYVGGEERCNWEVERYPVSTRSGLSGGPINFVADSIITQLRFGHSHPKDDPESREVEILLPQIRIH